MLHTRCDGEFVTVTVTVWLCCFQFVLLAHTATFLACSLLKWVCVSLCVRECVFFFVSTSFGFIRCYVDIHLALLYCSVTVNVKMPFRKFDILYLDIFVLKALHTHKLCRWIKMSTNIIFFFSFQFICFLFTYLHSLCTAFACALYLFLSYFYFSFWVFRVFSVSCMFAYQKSKTLRYVVCVVHNW